MSDRGCIHSGNGVVDACTGQHAFHRDGGNEEEGARGKGTMTTEYGSYDVC